MLGNFSVSRFSEKQRTFGALFAIFLVALSLRLINLGKESLWGDEILSLAIVRQLPSLGELWNYIAWVEIHPPFYYFTLHYWVEWFGSSEFAVRSLSVLFGLIIVGLTYALSISLFRSRRLALIASFLVAILPLQIEMTTDARPYAIFTALGLVGVLSLWTYVVQRRWQWLLMYVASLAIAFYFHYSAAIIIASLALTWLGYILVTRQGNWHRDLVIWFAAQAAIVVAYAPWLQYVLYKMHLRSFVLFGLESYPDPVTRSSAFTSYVPQQLVWLSLENHSSKIEIIAIWLVQLALLGILLWYVRDRSRRHSPLIESAHYRPLLFVGALTVSTLVIFLLSPQSVPYTDIYIRHILIWTVYFAILLAYVVTVLPRRAGLAFLALFVTTLLTFMVNVVSNDDQWDIQHRLKFVAGVVNEYHQPGDIIITENAFFRTDFNYYLRPELEAIPFMPTNYTDKDLYNTRNTLGLMENELQFRLHPPRAFDVFYKFDYLINKHKPKRVWLPYFTSPMADIYFTNRGWKKVIWAKRPLFMLDMYEAPTPVEKNPVSQK